MENRTESKGEWKQRRVGRPTPGENSASSDGSHGGGGCCLAEVFEGQLIGLTSGLDVVYEGRVRDVSKVPDSATCKKGFDFAFREMEKAAGDAGIGRWKGRTGNWKICWDILNCRCLCHSQVEMLSKVLDIILWSLELGLNLVVSVYMVFRVKRMRSSRERESKCKN